jgi:hypothetical protein
MANVSQQSAPNFFFSQRFSTYESSYLRVRPHRSALRKIIEAMTAQYEPASFENGDCFRTKQVTGHSSTLDACEHREIFGVSPEAFREHLSIGRFDSSAADCF